MIRLSRPAYLAPCLLLGLAAACSETTSIGNMTTSTGSGESSTSTGAGAGDSIPGAGTADKVDILLAIDNSQSMADKQSFLALAVQDLTRALINPTCVNDANVPTAIQPSAPGEDCPAGAHREYLPVTDVHIGVISSSIGSAGADTCVASSDRPTVDDHGHLLTRLDASMATDPNLQVPTYQNQGFLAWDPAAKLNPPGETDPTALAARLMDMVIGVGQFGCGYEASLESWYRFLIDPEPYATISLVDGIATPQGVDSVLLDQRKAFLRPDSLVAIIMLTDENDCSIIESGQYWYAAQLGAQGGQYHLPRARHECETDPNDACCKSCASDPGDCPPAPECEGNPPPALSELEDQGNVRCFDQKRRFGIDFLYPTDRYVTGLTQTTIPNRAGEMVPNPLYTEFDAGNGLTGVRSPGFVLLTGIVGVPWQDLARDPDDLTKGFRSADELADTSDGPSRWDVVLGDPSNGIRPLDPLMIETWQIRTGTNPITGDVVAPPESPIANPVNGNDYSIPEQNDLQYACIFDLPEGRNCGENSTSTACDCSLPVAGPSTTDNPLCAVNPGDDNRETLQVRAKAYPAVRELQVMKGLGDQAVVTSICPSQIDDPKGADYAYRPAAAALLERVRPLLVR